MKPPGLSESQQRHPAAHRIGQVMQHPARLDHVERPVGRANATMSAWANSICSSRLGRLALRIGKACEAEIDREHARGRKASRGLDRLLAGAATRDQDVGRRRFGDIAHRRRAGTPAQVRARCRSLARRRDRPARIGIVLVLLRAPSARRRSVIVGQPRHGGAKFCLAFRLAHLFGDQGRHLVRPLARLEPGSRSSRCSGV